MLIGVPLSAHQMAHTHFVGDAFAQFTKNHSLLQELAVGAAVPHRKRPIIHEFWKQARAGQEHSFLIVHKSTVRRQVEAPQLVGGHCARKQIASKRIVEQAEIETADGRFFLLVRRFLRRLSRGDSGGLHGGPRRLIPSEAHLGNVTLSFRRIYTLRNDGGLR